MAQVLRVKKPETVPVEIFFIIQDAIHREKLVSKHDFIHTSIKLHEVMNVIKNKHPKFIYFTWKGQRIYNPKHLYNSGRMGR